MTCEQVRSTQMYKQGKYYLPRLIFGSIKTQQKKNVWESLSDLSRPGRQAVTLTTLPELGRGVFVPEAPGHAGLCLGCWRRDTRLSPSAPRSSGSAQSESL